MSGQWRNAEPTRQGKRHPLLLQRALNEQVFWPGVLILAVGGGLLVWNPVRLEPWRLPLTVVFAGTGLILALTFALRPIAYVQCRAAGLRLRLPFYRLTIPYGAIKASRPTELFRLYPPRELHQSQRRFLRSLLGWTVVVVELDRLPRSRSWLRLWMSKYMLHPNAVGLILPIEDWLTLHTELDEFRARRRYLRDDLQTPEKTA